jgi:predicted AAA+ superfamily ATPase
LYYNQTMYFERDLKEKVKQSITNSNKLIILYGARQVGKTTFLKKIIQSLEYKTLLVNGDEMQYNDILSSRDLTKLKLLVHGYEMLFVDEAQRIKDIGINLKILHDQLPQLKVIASGSSSFELANRIKEPLTGRTRTFNLYPISVSEMLKTFSPIEINNKIEELLIYGQYPEVLCTGNMHEKEILLNELSSSYLYKDILELSTIKNSDKLRKLLKLLAFQIGGEVSSHEIGKQLSLSNETVNSYIDLLEKSFVIFKLGGFSKNLRKEVTKKQKIYFYDLGIRNAIINNFNTLENRNDQGQMWENFIILERLKYNSYRFYTPNYYFWRLYSGAELDLIEEKDGKIQGVEVKYRKKKNVPPQSWTDAYPDSGYKNIHYQNYLSFISDLDI